MQTTTCYSVEMHCWTESLALVSAVTTRKWNSTHVPPSLPHRSQLISVFKPHLNLKRSHPHPQSSPFTHALLGEGKDWRTALYFVRVRVTVRGALMLCSSGGQLITLVWGLMTGHHQPALCCCQEPFTPSSFSPNGTSESIKTIITANPIESKEIILGGQRKHGWGVWIFLSREQLDVHLARQPITVSIFCICLVWIHWWSQQGFLRRCKGGRSLEMNRPLFEHADPVFWSHLGGCLVGNRNLCLSVLDGVQTLSTTMFLLPPWLNEPLSASTQYLFSEDLHCASERSIAGLCVFERLSALLQDS